MNYAPVKTASTWDSYKDALQKVLKAFNPFVVLEYGPGESTKIIQNHTSVGYIDTIEHNEAWAGRYKDALNQKVQLYIESNEFKYIHLIGRFSKYDLIFVDGLRRSSCLGVARFRLKDTGMVILHDAERLEYKDGIDLYEFKFFVDDGHTVILTDNRHTATKLSEVLWSE